ncbi:MAG TPA: diguanylate cyclase [Anaerolineales bacterium]|nr:diguanylate cyclase [Anaerolineales bacterium]
MSDSTVELETRLAEAADLSTRIDLMNELAWELRDTDPVRSHSLSESAYQLATSGQYEQQPYQTGLITSLRSLAFASRRAGDLSLSLSQSTQALARLEGASLPAVEADILQNVAIILGSLGDYAEALEYAFKGLHLAQSAGDRSREARLLSSLGVIYLHSKNIDESLRTFRQALQLNRQLGEKRYEALVLNNISLSLNAQGNHPEALETSLAALRLAGETGFLGLTVTATGTVGETCLAMADYAQAERYLQEYLEAARSAGLKRDEAWALILLGETHHRQGLDASALSCLSQAFEIAGQLGLRAETARCHELMAEIYEQQGDLRQALDQLKRFSQVKETIYNEATARKIANLQVIHQVESARKNAELQYLKTIELQKEIERRKEAESALKELATLDTLTGVSNRRKFFTQAEKKVQSALKKQQPLSMVLLDVDHFKRINDNYGHAVGDQALTAIARIIRANLRRGEMVGRLGGDEFAILLPGSDGLQGQQVARRLQERIASQPFQLDHATFPLTASLGIAELDLAHADTLSLLLERADQAMYSAKRLGRNRTAMYQPN